MNKAEKVEFVKETLRNNGFKTTGESVSIGIKVIEDMELNDFNQYAELHKSIKSDMEILNKRFEKIDSAADLNKAIIIHITTDIPLMDFHAEKPDEYYLVKIEEDKVMSFWNGEKWQNRSINCPSYTKEKAGEYSMVLTCSITKTKNQ